MSYKTKIFLKKGWNLVSFYMEDIILDSVISNKNILEIKSLNKNYNSKIPINLNSLKNLKVKTGYWILSLSNTVINLEGTPNKNKIAIVLNKGWNLIGYPYKIEQDLSITDKIVEMKSINNMYNNILPKNLNTLKKLEPGIGYWCKCLEDTILNLEYPFKYVKKDDNNQISNLIINDELDINTITSLYKKQTFYIEHTEKTNIEVPWIASNKIINRNDLENIKNSLFELKITVYYGNVDGLEKSVGIYLHDHLSVLSNYTGNINIKPSDFNEKDKIIYIYFDGQEENKILFNINRNLIVVGYKDGYSFINDIKYTKIDDIVENTNNSINSIFLTDYKFESIKIKELSLLKNTILLNTSNITYTYENSVLKIKFYTKDESYILEIMKDDNANKTVIINFTTEAGESISQIKKQIIFNKLFDLKIGDNVYSISFQWDSEQDNIKFNVSEFSISTNYLYWYNFNNIKFNNIALNDINLTNYTVLEKYKDHILLESTYDNVDYKFFIIKDSMYKGCINLIIKYKEKNITDYTTQNTININWTIYNDTSFYINNNLIKLSWEGALDSNGYAIKNVQIIKQRLFATGLNASKIVYVDNFAFKIHYMIGNTKDSINLNKWNSYNSFLESLEKLLNYLMEYVKLYKLELPRSDLFLRKNGGDSNYDIYIKDIENDNIKGYTTGEHFITHTHNPNDVVSYMVLSNNLDYDWLKTVLFHEFFHSIQGSYDWFDIEWISEGLAVAFEVGLSNNSISSKYFIPDLLEKKNLALSYYKSFTFGSDYSIISQPISIYGGENGDIIIEMKNLKHYYDYIDIKDLTISDIFINPINDTTMIIKKFKVDKYRGQYILRLFITSNKGYNYLKFRLYINKKLITNATSAYSSRHYGTFAFFTYLIGKYNETQVFSTIMNESITYDNDHIIEKAIKKINPKSSFINELVDFWCATEIMSSSNKINEKYRLKYANLWNRMYITDTSRKLEVKNDYEHIVIDDLEPTGCVVLDIIFNEYKSAAFKIDDQVKFDLIYIRLLCESIDGSYDVKEVIPQDNFNIIIDENISRIKLLFIGDTKYPSNREIPISVISKESLKSITNVKTTNKTFTFKLKVLT